jgi:hypothetical protein
MAQQDGRFRGVHRKERPYCQTALNIPPRPGFAGEHTGADQHAAQVEIHAQGFIPYFAPRKLDRLVPPLLVAQ